MSTNARCSVSLYTVNSNHLDSALDGTHSGKIGGRYNPPGSEPTLYLARSYTLASLECEQEQLMVGMTSGPVGPRVVFSVRIRNAHVLDLRNPIVQANLSIKLEDLRCPNAHWKNENESGRQSIPQQIGEAVRSTPDADGLVVPSWLQIVGPSKGNPPVLPEMDNLVLFMGRSVPRKPRRSTVGIEIYDPGKTIFAGTP
jgi:RES domain-containing protein